MEVPEVDGFLIEVDLGGPRITLRFDRVGQSAGQWHQVQYRDRGVRINSAMPSMGEWSLGLRDATMQESVGLTFDNTVGSGSHKNEIWLYANMGDRSGAANKRVASIEGFPSFPPIPRRYRGGQVTDGRITVFDASGKMSSVGTGFCSSCNWQDVSQRGLFKTSTWKFETSEGMSAGADIALLGATAETLAKLSKLKLGVGVSGSAGSYYFEHPTAKGMEYYETFYYAAGMSVGLDLAEVGKWASTKFDPLFQKISTLAAPLITAAKNKATAAAVTVAAKAPGFAQGAQAAATWVGNKAPAAAPLGKMAATGSVKSMTSGAFWNVFYGPDAGSELGPNDFQGQCYIVDFGGSYCIQGGSLTLVLFNADMPPLLMGLLCPPILGTQPPCCTARTSAGSSRERRFPSPGEI